MVGKKEVGAGEFAAIEAPHGADLLLRLTSSHRDLQQARIAAGQRELPELAADIAALEKEVAGKIDRQLKKHVLWPWLVQFPGLRGIHTARLIAIIGDPRRFPGQQCTNGHTMEPDYEVGGPCPALGRDDESCPGTMLEPRTTTGVRSLWRYSGVDVDENGRLPRLRKGTQGHWNQNARLALLQPGGIAEQIVRHRVEPYRSKYDATKTRITEERGVEAFPEIEEGSGAALLEPHKAEAESGTVIDAVGGLRPIRIDKIARTVAAKAFEGDLLTAWKALVGATVALDCVGGGGLP